MSDIQPIRIREAEFAYLAENYGGFCIQCRTEAYGVEPDARHYRCEACDERAVFGAEELLFHGLITFIED